MLDKGKGSLQTQAEGQGARQRGDVRVKNDCLGQDSIKMFSTAQSTLNMAFMLCRAETKGADPRGIGRRGGPS